MCVRNFVLTKFALTKSVLMKFAFTKFTLTKFALTMFECVLSRHNRVRGNQCQIPSYSITAGQKSLEKYDNLDL